MDGRYTENEGTLKTVDVDELTCFIPFDSKKHTEAEFIRLADDLRLRFAFTGKDWKWSPQDSVILKLPGGKIMMLGTSGKDAKDVGRVDVTDIAEPDKTKWDYDETGDERDKKGWTTLKKGAHKGRKFSFDFEKQNIPEKCAFSFEPKGFETFTQEGDGLGDAAFTCDLRGDMGGCVLSVLQLLEYGFYGSGAEGDFAKRGKGSASHGEFRRVEIGEQGFF